MVNSDNDMHGVEMNEGKKKEISIGVLGTFGLG